MQVMPLGINYSTRKLLIDPISSDQFGENILDSLSGNIGKAGVATRGIEVAEELQRQGVDLGDPHAAGWTVLLNSKDPQKAERLQAIQALAEFRGLDPKAEPLYYNGEGPEDWADWLTDNYSELIDKKPFYILILGGPKEVPFHFQSMLSTMAAVGRLDFDAAADIRAYADKIIRLEKADSPTVKRQAVFFATDHGKQPQGWMDPTFYSHQLLAKPLAETVTQEQGLDVTTLFAADATKARLSAALVQTRPALVFTASHGLGAPDQTLEKQKAINGAICCQDEPASDDAKWFFSAADVPTEPFLEGAAFFQFACFGYGTPAESDFAHWDPKMGNAFNAKADFVGALPRRLLAHPQGPIVFIGHLDVALLNGFDDPDNPGGAEDPWHARAAPFYKAVKDLLEVRPAGLAVRAMNERYNAYNSQLTTLFDLLQRRKLTADSRFQERLVDNFLIRSDAQNYMILGDPAAHLRIPK